MLWLTKGFIGAGAPRTALLERSAAFEYKGAGLNVASARGRLASRRESAHGQDSHRQRPAA